MDAEGIEPKETIPASRKLGREVAEELASQASHVVVSRGRKVREWRRDEIGEGTVEAMLGPTGNLRAPSLRAGKLVVVGFQDESWNRLLS